MPTKSGVGNKEWGVGARVADTLLPRLGRLAAGYGAGKALLLQDSRLSTHRGFRPDGADPAGRSFSPRQYCGRQRTREHRVLYPVSSGITGFAERTGNSRLACSGGRIDARSGRRANPGRMRAGWQTFASTDQNAARQGGRGILGRAPHSPFPIPHSPIARSTTQAHAP
jgi:hypothetical protein